MSQESKYPALEYILNNVGTLDNIRVSMGELDLIKQMLGLMPGTVLPEQWENLHKAYYGKKSKPEPKVTGEKKELFIANTKADIQALFSDIAVLRGKLGLWNVGRLALLFGKASAMSLIVLINQSNFFDTLHKTIKKVLDAKKLLSHLVNTNMTFAAFSVFFFWTRLLIDLLLFLRHTLLATEEEKKLANRGAYEVSKRYGRVINDALWGTANFLANFQKITHISSAVATWLTPAILAFDLTFLIIQYLQARSSYLAIKAVLEKSDNKNKAALLAKHEGEWAKKQTAFAVNIIAAITLLVAYTTTLMVPGAVSALACFSLCSVAISLYLNSGKAGELREKQRLAKVYKDYPNVDYMVAKARNALIRSLIIDAVVPMIISTIYAIYFPAAIALTIAYMASSFIYNQVQPRDNKLAIDYALFPVNPEGIAKPDQNNILT